LPKKTNDKKRNEMTPTNEKRTSLAKRLLISTGVIVALVTGIVLMKLSKKGPPIEVGDGSITFHYQDGIQKKSDTQIEVDKLLRKVRSISIGDYNQPPSSKIDVQKRKWTLTSNSTPQFQLSRNEYLLEDGVAGTCPVAWTGSGLLYTCTPAGGTQLTPVTITFSDGNCPGTTSPSCTLSCASGKCLLQLEYK